MDLIKIMKVGKETIEIWRFGKNDYAINYFDADYSLRGTLTDILTDLEEFLKEEF